MPPKFKKRQRDAVEKKKRGSLGRGFGQPARFAMSPCENDPGDDDGLTDLQRKVLESFRSDIKKFYGGKIPKNKNIVVQNVDTEKVKVRLDNVSCECELCGKVGILDQDIRVLRHQTTKYRELSDGASVCRTCRLDIDRYDMAIDLHFRFVAFETAVKVLTEEVNTTLDLVENMEKRLIEKVSDEVRAIVYVALGKEVGGE